MLTHFFATDNDWRTQECLPWIYVCQQLISIGSDYEEKRGFYHINIWYWYLHLYFYRLISKTWGIIVKCIFSLQLKSIKPILSTTYFFLSIHTHCVGALWSFIPVLLISILTVLPYFACNNRKHSHSTLPCLESYLQLQVWVHKHAHADNYYNTQCIMSIQMVYPQWSKSWVRSVLKRLEEGKSGRDYKYPSSNNKTGILLFFKGKQKTDTKVAV